MDKTGTHLSVFEELFSDQGLLAKSLPIYEQRIDQQKMAEKIWSSFEDEENALFEAGTGIGKSLAYLIPALLWAHQSDETVVISTYTISLQQQLIEKDIPFLLKTLGLELSVVLAKGMGNYVCLKNLEELTSRGHILEEASTYSGLTSWADKTSDGSKSSLPFSVPGEVWSSVKADSETCSYVKCPHYNQCFFFKARAKRQEAHVIVVNHHLLMSHLLAEEGQGGLPPFSRLVVDEAHHLEPVALSSLAQTLDRVDLFKSMARVHSDAHPEVSRFHVLQTQLKEIASSSLKERLSIDLPGQKRTLTTQINEAFDQLDQGLEGSNRFRVTSQILGSKHWQEELIPLFIDLKEKMGRLRTSLESLVVEVNDLRLEEQEKRQIESALFDITSVANYLKKKEETLKAFFSDSEDESVRWIESTRTGCALTVAKLDVDSFLQEKLFIPLKTSVLCSATLTVENNFSHLCKRVGLLPEPSTKEVYPSPFDYKERSRLFGVSDLPPPGSYDFIQEASQQIAEAVKITQGGAFVLFTSYDMLHKCGNRLEELLGVQFPIFKQGDLSRHLLLEEYKEAGNGVLLGADSFWEGVDVVGPALRLVIIVKLPFPVPSDPIIEARGEKLKREGKEPFWEDSVPQAVVKFKQGFGRLMRSKEDMGCVLCLDSRLFTRSYGKQFLKSLPECITDFAPKVKIFEQMKHFYRGFGA